MTALAFWLLVGFMVFVYFEPSVLFPALSGLQLPLVLLSSALLLALAGGVRLVRAPGNGPLLALLVLGALSVLAAPVPSGQGFLTPIWAPAKAAVLYFTVLAVACSSERLRALLLANLSLAAVMAGGSLLANRSGIPPLTGGKLARMSNYFGGIGDDTNEMGLVLLPFVALSLALVRPGPGRRVRNLIVLTALGLFVLCVIRTRSRGAFLGLLAIFLYYLWDNRRYARRLLLGLLVAVAVFFHVSDTYWMRMATITDKETAKEDFNAQSRLVEWGYVLELMRRYPLLGVGLGNYVEAKKQILHVAPYRDGLYYVQHNAYLAVGSEMGVPALVCFLALVLGTIRRLSRSPPPGAVAPLDEDVWMRLGLKYGLAGMAVSLFFLTEWFNVVFFVLLAAAQVVVAGPPAGAAPVSERLSLAERR